MRICLPQDVEEWKVHSVIYRDRDLLELGDVEVGRPSVAAGEPCPEQPGIGLVGNGSDDDGTETENSRGLELLEDPARQTVGTGEPCPLQDGDELAALSQALLDGCVDVHLLPELLGIRTDIVLPPLAIGAGDLELPVGPPAPLLLDESTVEGLGMSLLREVGKPGDGAPFDELGIGRLERGRKLLGHDVRIII